MSGPVKQQKNSGRVRPIWIDGPGGKLFAIVHDPDPSNDLRKSILMLSAGQDSRTGPQRLYVRAARRFASAGFTVVRLDLSGTGDSLAENSKIFLDSHSVEDVDAGVRWVRDSFDTGVPYLVALCAGARVALRYAAHHQEIPGVVAWSVPTTSEGDTPYLNTQGAKKALASRKLLTAVWWKNRWKYGLKEIGQISNALLNRIYASLGIRRESYFVRCMDKYLSDQRPAFFMFGALDNIVCSDFEERFPSVPEGNQHEQGYRIIPEAVHALSSVAAHQSAIEASLEWLQYRVAVDVGESASIHEIPTTNRKAS